jgi:cleavage and polyadenylation specificity factor subunit 3
MIKFLPLGGADDIGAGCFYLNIFGTGILLDCGIHPRKKEKDSLPEFSLIKNEPLDFVLISHAHQDHIGALPFLVQDFPHVIIYSTYQTKEIAELVLHNAANIISIQSCLEEGLRNYTHEEIDFLVRSMRDVEYNEELELRGLRQTLNDPIRIKFVDAGHILGAASIIIEIAGEKIVYTGDINFGNQKLMIGADNHLFRNTSCLILETTYGGTDSLKLGTWSSESHRFAKHANSILNAGGSVLVPVFALGKTQELLATIYDLIKRRILTETLIYTGGIGKEISAIYDRSRYLVKYSDTDIILKDIPQMSIHDIEDFNFYKKNPGIVLASSGMMLDGTASNKLCRFWLKQPNFGIFGVGYMDKDTPGFGIMNAKYGDEISFSGEEKPQKALCQIERFYFPSHSKREDLVELVRKIKPGKVILVHGDALAKDWIGSKILGILELVKLYSAEIGKQINLN